MKPLTIEVENFLSFPGKVKLDLTNIPSAAVCGPNGAGKSSIVVDAILFAVFGKARKRPEELINDLATSAEVSLSLSHQGNNYIICRQVKKGKNQTLKISRDGEDISERLLTETQSKLEKILGVSYNLLLSTAIAQQDEINSLSTMTPGDREKILSEMLSLGVWETKKQKVLDFLNENKDLTQKVMETETELTVLNQLVKDELDTEIEKYSNELLLYKNNYETVEKEVKQLDEKFKQYEESSKSQNKLDVAKSKIESLEKQASEIKVDDEIDTALLENRIKDNEISINNCKEGQKISTDELEFNTKVLIEASEYLQLLPQTEILDKVPCVGLDIHDKCELLSQAIETKKKISKYRSYEKSDIATCRQVEKEIKEHIAFLKDAESKLVAENFSNQSKLEQAKRNKTNKVKKIQLELEIAQQKQGLKRLESEAKTCEFDFELYNKTKAKLDEILLNSHQIEVYLAGIKSKKENSLERIKVLDEIIEKLKEKENSLANYKTLYNAYNEIPALLFEQAIPTIENYANEILQVISPDKQVELRTFKETKSNTIKKTLDVVSNTSTGVRDFANLSGSERFRESLALRLALARYNKETNNLSIDFFVVDEGFGSLDGINVVKTKMALKEIASRFDLFLIITHVSELADTFDKQVLVNPIGKQERIIIQEVN